MKNPKLKPKRKPNGGSYAKGTALSYQGVLDEIEASLQSMEQWAGLGLLGRAHEYYCYVEALVSLLEVHNCGSTGGFDEGQTQTQSIYQRWQWLVKKGKGK